MILVKYNIFFVTENNTKLFLTTENKNLATNDEIATSSQPICGSERTKYKSSKSRKSGGLFSFFKPSSKRASVEKVKKNCLQIMFYMIYIVIFK